METSFGVVDCLEDRRGNPCLNRQVKGKPQENEKPAALLRNPNKITNSYWYYLMRYLGKLEGVYC
jgi:hypothetical protein